MSILDCLIIGAADVGEEAVEEEAVAEAVEEEAVEEAVAEVVEKAVASMIDDTEKKKMFLKFPV